MAVKSRQKRKPYASELRSAATDATQARIIAAARALLGQDDAPTFSLDLIARKAGVTRLTVYNQFESKRGLLEAVFDDMAREGGLFELQSVLAEPNVDVAMQRFVTVFCKFWAMRRKPMPKLMALAKLDADFAATFHERVERRRKALAVLVSRLPSVSDAAALTDLLFAITGFEMFEALSVRGRGTQAVEKLVQQLVKDLVKRHSASMTANESRLSG